MVLRILRASWTPRGFLGLRCYRFPRHMGCGCIGILGYFGVFCGFRALGWVCLWVCKILVLTRELRVLPYSEG